VGQPQHSSANEFSSEVSVARSGLDDSHRILPLYERTGHPKEAEIVYKEAISLWKAAAEEYPQLSEYRLSLAESYNGLGDVYKATGRAKQAEEAHKEAEASIDHGASNRDSPAAAFVCGDGCTSSPAFARSAASSGRSACLASWSLSSQLRRWCSH
jgi:tetratricopeptide (TPR) repeat protein